MSHSRNIDSKMFNWDQVDWQTMRWYVEKLPVGLLWGAGLALCSPTDPTVGIVAAWVFVVFGSVTALCFRPVLQAAKFHHIALFIALFCITHGSISYIGLHNLADDKSVMCEITSRLREFAVITACVSSCLVNFHSIPPREVQQDPERPASLPLDVPTPAHRAMDSSLKDRLDVLPCSDKHEYHHNADNLALQLTGPGSTRSQSTHSSDISLSSVNRVSPTITHNLIQWEKTVNPMKPARDEGPSASY